MATIALARPGTIATLVASGGAVGQGGSATFLIHVQAWQDSYEVKLTEVTGDTHVAPEFQHGGLLYGQFRLSGYMLAGSNVGIANLVANVNGGYGVGTGSTAAHELEVRFDSNRAIRGKVVITTIQRQMSKTSPHVQVAMSGFFTGGNPTEVAVAA